MVFSLYERRKNFLYARLSKFKIRNLNSLVKKTKDISIYIIKDRTVAPLDD